MYEIARVLVKMPRDFEMAGIGRDEGTEEGTEGTTEGTTEETTEEGNPAGLTELEVHVP